MCHQVPWFTFSLTWTSCKMEKVHAICHGIVRGRSTSSEGLQGCGNELCLKIQDSLIVSK